VIEEASAFFVGGDDDEGRAVLGEEHVVHELTPVQNYLRFSSLSAGVTDFAACTCSGLVSSAVEGV